MRDDGYRLRDLNSRNGTFVGDLQIRFELESARAHGLAGRRSFRNDDHRRSEKLLSQDVAGLHLVEDDTRRLIR